MLATRIFAYMFSLDSVVIKAKSLIQQRKDLQELGQHLLRHLDVIEANLTVIRDRNLDKEHKHVGDALYMTQDVRGNRVAWMP